jgi:hypothetical protein
VAAAPIVLSCALAAALAHGKISFLAHHSQRGVQIESLVGSLVMFAQAFFQLFHASVDTNFGAQHLGQLPGAVLGSRVLFYGALAFTYPYLALHRRRYSLLAGSWLAISGFVTFGYVLSPQFLLWLIPLGLLAVAEIPPGWRRAAWVACFAMAVALTGAHFRYYWDYVNFHYLATSMVLARNLLLLTVWILSWRWMAAKKPVAGAAVFDKLPA